MTWSVGSVLWAPWMSVIDMAKDWNIVEIFQSGPQWRTENWLNVLLKEGKHPKHILACFSITSKVNFVQRSLIYKGSPVALLFPPYYSQSRKGAWIAQQASEASKSMETFKPKPLRLINYFNSTGTRPEGSFHTQDFFHAVSDQTTETNTRQFGLCGSQRKARCDTRVPKG